MVVNQPHFLLFCDTNLSSTKSCAVGDQGFGRWHFVLERLDGPERLEVADSEAPVHRDRLALLAVVRGLEALEQPSSVTLVTTSRYVSRGLRYGLNEWREAEYTWEHFGAQRPIRNADLWQRVDRALGFHRITCRLLQSQLAQAIVETVTEMDEISVLSHPQPSSLESEMPTTVASARSQKQTLQAGIISPEATDCEHQKVSAMPVGTIHRVDAAHMPLTASQVDTSPSIEPLSRSDQLSAQEQVAHSIINQRFRRLKISFSIPVIHLRQSWWKLAMAWIGWLRSRSIRSRQSPALAHT